MQTHSLYKSFTTSGQAFPIGDQVIITGMSSFSGTDVTAHLYSGMDNTGDPIVSIDDTKSKSQHLPARVGIDAGDECVYIEVGGTSPVVRVYYV